jgi:hypothetical protein
MLIRFPVVDQKDPVEDQIEQLAKHLHWLGLIAINYEYDRKITWHGFPWKRVPQHVKSVYREFANTLFDTMQAVQGL